MEFLKTKRLGKTYWMSATGYPPPPPPPFVQLLVLTIAWNDKLSQFKPSRNI